LRENIEKMFVPLVFLSIAFWCGFQRVAALSIGRRGTYGALSCPRLTPRPTPPKNVNDLRPDDFGAVMALGDSVSAAFLAFGGPFSLNSTSLPNENRGVSFTIGGDSTYPPFVEASFASKPVRSIFNFVRSLNPNVVGASTGSHPFEFCNNGTNKFAFKCGLYQDSDGLSAAESGMVAADVLNVGVPRLISQLNGPFSSVKHSWKLLHISIGGNDLCSSCSQEDPNGFFSADNYESFISQSLEKLRDESNTGSKILVNLISNLPVQNIPDSTDNVPFCPRNVNPNASIFGDEECGCVFRPDLNTGSPTDGRVQVANLQREYNLRLQKISLYYQSLGDPHFSVIFDPSFGNFNLATSPFTVLSDTDCFHISFIGHASFATALWNNLFFEIEQKKYCAPT